MGTLTDTSTWHLSTSGGIPYALIEGFPKGKVTSDSASFTEEIIIKTPNLLAFLTESYPQPLIYGNLFFLRGRPRPMPGFPLALTSNISVEPFPPGRPADPFWADSRNSRTAPDVIHESYSEFIKVIIEYTVGSGDDDNNQDPDPNDETSFLTISGNAAGEFLNTKATGGQKIDQGIDANGDPVFTDVKNPDIDILVTVPETEWTVTWKHIPDAFFRDTFKERLDNRLGTVNSDTASKILFKAPPQTILLAGYGLRQEFSSTTSLALLLAGQKIGPPSIALDIKFLEKRVNYLDEGKWRVAGHNHAWVPGQGWRIMTRDPKGNPLYDKMKFANIFIPD